MDFQSPLVDVKDFKRSDDLCSISIVVPGFNNGDYGRDQNLTTTAIMKVVTTAELIAFGNDRDKTILGHDWLRNRDMTTFSLTFDLKMSEAAYNPYTSKSELLSVVTIIYMGISSLKVLTQIFCKGNRHVPILSYIHHFVNVSFKTRRPMPWPSSMVEVFTKRQSPRAHQLGIMSKRSQLPTRPAHTFVYNVYVAWSDTDANKHVNFSTYAKYADDALRAALRCRGSQTSEGSSTSTSTDRNGRQSSHPLNVSENKSDKFLLYQGDPSLALIGIRAEVVECGTKEFKVHYLKECVEDDFLQVHVWQDGVQDNIVFTSIEKSDGIIAQTSTEFFTSKSKL